MTKQNLFQKLYKDWKNILQSWALKNAQAKMSSKINWSIVLAHEEVDNSTSKIRDMLCSIKEWKFEHTEYVKLKMEINKQKEIINDLVNEYTKFDFSVKYF